MRWRTRAEPARQQGQIFRSFTQLLLPPGACQLSKWSLDYASIASFRNTPPLGAGCLKQPLGYMSAWASTDMNRGRASVVPILMFFIAPSEKGGTNPLHQL